MNKYSSKKNYRRLQALLIGGISSSLMVSSYVLPINAETIKQKMAEFIIASLPIDDPKINQGITELVPQTATPETPEAPKTPINPPIQPKKNSTQTVTNNNSTSDRNISPRPSTSNRNTSPRPSTSARNTSPRPSTSARNTSPRPSTSNSTNRNSNNSARNSNNERSASDRSFVISTNNSSKEPVFKNIDFVDIPFGILSPGDFKFEGRYVHFYKFEGQANQIIQLRLTGSVDKRRSNNLSLQPYLFLFDPDNQVILRRGSAERSQNIKDAYVFAKLPATGSYTIAVTSQNPGDIGRYTLALRNDRASYIEDAFTELTKSSATLKNGSPYNITKLEGKKGQLVSIRADSIFEEFSPFIVLLNAKGQVVSADNATAGTYSALIDRAKLPEDGSYYVMVISKNPTRVGKYRLTIF